MQIDQGNIKHHISHLRPILLQILVAFILVSVTTWVVISTMVTRNSEIRTSVLTLKREACAYLRNEGIHAQPISESESLCALSASFSANHIGNGGVIYLADRQIEIADNQLVAVEAKPDQSHQQSQVSDLALIIACTGLLLGILIWFYTKF